MIMASAGLHWAVRLAFLGYGATLFGVLWVCRQSWMRSEAATHQDREAKQANWVTIVALGALGVLLLTRLIPFLRFGEAPLGYDTGFYVGSIRSLYQTNTPASSALYLSIIPWYVAGIPPALLYHVFHVLTQLFLAGALYFLLASFSVPLHRRLAAAVLAAFALSAVQFLGYWWAFTQQMLGMGFLLIAMGFFLRRSYWTPLFALLAFLLHTPTGAVLLLTLAVYHLVYIVQLFRSRRYVDRWTNVMLVMGLVALPVAVWVKWNDVANLFSDVFRSYGVFLAQVPSERALEFRGNFIGSDVFRWLILGSIPLSCFTIVHPEIWWRRRVSAAFFYRHLLLLYAALAVLVVLTFAPVIYQARFSIMLDLVLLVFTAPALLVLVEHVAQRRSGYMVLVGALAMAPISMGLTVWHQRPMITTSELREMKNFPALAEPHAGVLVTDSYYAPWLWGFATWGTVAPGYLGDSWSHASWERFWYGSSDEERLQMLSARDHPQPPLYLYLGERQQQEQPYEWFIRSSPVFVNVSPHLWKFIGDPRPVPVFPST